MAVYGFGDSSRRQGAPSEGERGVSRRCEEHGLRSEDSAKAVAHIGWKSGSNSAYPPARPAIKCIKMQKTSRPKGARGAVGLIGGEEKRKGGGAALRRCAAAPRSLSRSVGCDHPGATIWSRSPGATFVQDTRMRPFG